MFDALLSAAGKGIGAWMDSRTADKNREAGAAQAAANIALQKKFAKEAIQWKVADAKKAGVHPLYALGAPTMSFSPVSLGGQSASNFADTFGSMGADLGTAISKGMPKEGVADAFTKTAQGLQLESLKLDNDIKRAKLASDIARVGQPGAQATLPIPEATKSDPRPIGWAGGSRIWTDPSTSNVDDFWQKRFGEPGEWAGAAVVGWNDLMHNLRKYSFGELLRMADRATRINRFWK